MHRRPLLLLVASFGVSACRPDVDGTWELVDATWTALESEEDGTVRTTEAILELTTDGTDVNGTGTLRQTTTIGDAAPTVEEESAPIEGALQSGDIWLPAGELFELECNAKGDQMVCTDSAADGWEFERTAK